MPLNGIPGCFFQYSWEIRAQWPGLKHLPRAEPGPEHAEDHRFWEKEYACWKVLRCERGRGYFCCRHGMWITCDEVTRGAAKEQRYESLTSCPSRHDELCVLIQSFHAEHEQIASREVGSGPHTSAEDQYLQDEDALSSEFGRISVNPDEPYEDDTSFNTYGSNDPAEPSYTHAPRGISESCHEPSILYSGQEAADSPQTLESDYQYSYDSGREATRDSWSPTTEYTGYEQDDGPQPRYNIGETGLASPPESLRKSGNKDSKSHHRSSKAAKVSHDPRESKRGSKKERRKD